MIQQTTASKAFHVACQQLVKLQAQSVRNRDATGLGWPLFLDRLLDSLALWAEQTGYQDGRWIDLSGEVNNDLTTELDRVVQGLDECKSIVRKAKEPESSDYQLSLQNSVDAVTRLAIPEVTQDIASRPGNRHVIIDHGWDDDIQLTLDEEDEAELRAPSSRASSRTPSMTNTNDRPWTSKLVNAVADIGQENYAHFRRLETMMPPRQKPVAARLELVLFEQSLTKVFQQALTAAGRSEELYTKGSLLAERLALLNDAFTSLIELEAEWLSHDTSLLGVLLQGLVSIIPKSNFPLVRSVWDCFSQLTEALPRANNYPFTCLEKEALVAENVADVWCETVRYGCDIFAYELNALGLPPLGDRKESPLPITSGTLAQLRQYSNILDVHALRDYMKGQATSPSVWRRFIEMEDAIRVKKAQDSKPAARSGPEFIPRRDGIDLHDQNHQQYHGMSSLKHDRRIFDVPYSLLTIHFRGRSDELSGLASGLAARQDKKTSLHLLHGADGMGKTQLALNFTSFLWEVFPDHHVFWLCAASSDKLSRGLDVILSKLQVDITTIRRAEERAQSVRNALHRLRATGQMWSLIVDDVQDSDAVGTLLALALPLKAPGSHVILMSRSAGPLSLSFLNPADITYLLVGRLSKEQAVEILIHASQLTKDDLDAGELEGAENVVNLLDCYALAVKQAGAYMKRITPSISFPTLLGLLIQCRADMKEPNAKIPEGIDPSASLPLLLSLQRVRVVSPEVYQTLEILAFLDSENIPLESLLKRLTRQKANSDPEYSSSRHHSPDPRREPIIHILSQAGGQERIVAELLKTSLVGQRSVGPIPRLRMHDQVQSLILTQMSHENRQSCLDQAVTMVANILEPLLDHLDKPRTWSQCDIMAPHLQTLVLKCEEYDLMGLRLYSLYCNFGWYFYTRGRYDDAARCYISCMPYLNDMYHVARERLAHVYLRLANMDAAREQLEQVFEKWYNGRPLLTPNNLNAADLLARCYYSQGSIAKAQALYQEVLEARTSTKRDDDYDGANTLEGLAMIHHRRGDDQAAEDLYRRVLLVRKQELGSKYLSLQRLRYHQARLLRDQGRTREAISIFKSVLHEHEDVLGENHPDTHRVACRLAFTYVQKGAFQKAEFYARRTLDTFADDESQHFAIAGMSRLVLANIASHRGEWQAAEELLVGVLTVYNARLGQTHPTTLHVRLQLSDVYQKQFQIDRAIALLEDIPSSYREGTAADAKLARLYDFQAEMLNDANKTNDALQLAQKTYMIQRERQGSLSADAVYTLWVLARIHVHRSDFHLACQLYSKALEGWERIPNAIGGDFNDLLEEYAQVLERVGNVISAMAVRGQIRKTEITGESFDPTPLLFVATDSFWLEEEPGISVKQAPIGQGAVMSANVDKAPMPIHVPLLSQEDVDDSYAYMYTGSARRDFGETNKPFSAQGGDASSEASKPRSALAFMNESMNASSARKVSDPNVSAKHNPSGSKDERQAMAAVGDMPQAEPVIGAADSVVEVPEQLPVLLSSPTSYVKSAGSDVPHAVWISSTEGKRTADNTSDSSGQILDLEAVHARDILAWREKEHFYEKKVSALERQKAEATQEVASILTRAQNAERELSELRASARHQGEGRLKERKQSLENVQEEPINRKETSSFHEASRSRRSNRVLPSREAQIRGFLGDHDPNEKIVEGEKKWFTGSRRRGASLASSRSRTR